MSKNVEETCPILGTFKILKEPNIEIMFINGNIPHYFRTLVEIGRLDLSNHYCFVI